MQKTHEITPTFVHLVTDIKAIFDEMKKRMQASASAIMVEGYWKIGKRLSKDESLVSHTATVRSLADELGIARSVLTRALQFYHAWPEGCPQPLYPSLSWSHYKELLTIKDKRTRTRLLGRAETEEWPLRRLRLELKTPTDANAPQIKPIGNTLLRRDSRLHVYKARLAHIVDGDTLVAHIDLGFDVWTKKRIRLRGIDTPEIKTPEGRRARAFLNTLIPQGGTIVIQTFVADLYGRYVADVFHLTGEKDKEKIFSGGRFLNQELLDAGFAVLL